MAFVMSLKRTKRVKHVGPDGSEVFQEDNRWQFLAAEDLASQDDKGANGEDKKQEEPSGSQQQKTPREGEVELLLDLVANVEDGQHLAVAQVPPPKNTLPGLTAQRALLVQAKAIQLRDAAARLARGAATLAARLEREQRYYRGAVQLQREWKLRASPPGGVSPLEVDLSLPFERGGARELRAAPVPLLCLPDGCLHVPPDADAAAAPAAPSAPSIDVQRAHAELAARQRRRLWGAVQAALDAEAAAGQPGQPWQDAGRLAAPPAGESSALQPLLLRLYLRSVDGDQRSLSEEARAWQAHTAFRGRVRAALQRHARSEPGMSARWLPATGRARSAVQVTRPGRPPALLLLTDEGTVRVEGGVDAKLGGAQPSGQDLDALLSGLMQGAGSGAAMIC